MNITIIIPCLNEITTIISVIEDISTNYPSLPIIVVDNGSSDGSQELLQQTSKVRFIVEPLRGKANAVKAAIPYVKTDFVALIDADKEYNIQDLIKFLPTKIDNDCMIIGVRPKNSMLLSSQLANKAIQLLMFIRYQKIVADCLTGLRLVPTSLLKQIKSTHFELETELTKLCLHLDYRIIELPIRYSPRIIGKKIKPSDMYKLLWVALQ